MSLSYDDKMEQISDKLIAAAVRDKQQRLDLLADFSPSLFKNENFLIYTILSRFKEQNLVPNGEFINIHLHQNTPLILDESNVDKSLFSETDADVVDEVIASTIEKLEEYNTETVDEDFLSEIPNDKQIFKELYKTKALDEVMETTNIILKDGLKQGHTLIQGPDAARDYFATKTAEIDSLVGNQGKESYAIQEVDLREGQMAHDKIGDFGALRKLDEVFDGVRAGMFYSVMAPPKSGKSKLAFNLLHNVAVKHGNNVMMWPYEGGKEKATAEIRAIHFVYYWEEKRGIDLGTDMFVPAKDILYDTYKTQEQREMEEESNDDLFNNTEYGQIIFIEAPLKADTYIAKLESEIDKNKPKMIVVDYLQLIGGASTGPLARQSKSERISQAYIETLALIKRKNVAFFSPAQMKQEAVKELSQGKESDTRVMGGESSEVIRTSDYNIALYGTPEDIRNGVETIKSIPSREAQPFPDLEIGIQLGYSYFYDIE